MKEKINAYLNKDLSLIPLRPKSKLPWGVWKDYQQMPMSHKELMEHFTRYPTSNLALVTGKLSGVIVLDIDSNDALEFAKKKGLVKTPTVITSRGYQMYFKYRNGVRNFQKKANLKDIDLRAEGGYVVLPPSIHPSGKRYEWYKGRSLDDLPLADLPDWVFAEDNSEKQPVSDLIHGVGVGERNNSLARVAGKLIGSGLALDECIQMSLGWNKQNNPPMSEEEVKRTVKNIYKRHIEKDFSDKDTVIDVLPPENVYDFLKRDIPELEYYVTQFLQKSGKTLVSAPTNVGKSLLSMNLILTLCSGEEEFLDTFEVEKGRCLYLDFEMGESAMKKRLIKMMGQNMTVDGLFVKSMLGVDLLEENIKDQIQKWIGELNIDILVLDPIGSAWSGDENNKQDAVKITSFLDGLVEKFSISVVVVHHWRKSTKDFKSGGEMAAGSYKWIAWPDNHVTIDGPINNLKVVCQKGRNEVKFDPFRIALDPERLTFVYAGDFSKKYTETDLMEIFDSFGQDRVKVVDIVKKAKEMGKGSPQTIRDLIKKSDIFGVDKSKKAHFIYVRNDTNVSVEDL